MMFAKVNFGLASAALKSTSMRGKGIDGHGDHEPDHAEGHESCASPVMHTPRKLMKATSRMKMSIQMNLIDKRV